MPKIKLFAGFESVQEQEIPDEELSSPLVVDELALVEDRVELTDLTEKTDGACDDVEQLGKFYDLLADNLEGGLSPDATKAVHIATEAICNRLGIVRVGPTLSLESLTKLDPKTSTRIAMEETAGIVKRTLDAIWEAIKRLAAMIKQFVNKVINKGKELLVRTKQAKEEFVEETKDKELPPVFKYIGDIEEAGVNGGKSGGVLHNAEMSNLLQGSIATTDAFKSSGIVTPALFLAAFSNYDNVFSAMGDILVDFGVILENSNKAFAEIRASSDIPTDSALVKVDFYQKFGKNMRKFTTNNFDVEFKIHPSEHSWTEHDKSQRYTDKVKQLDVELHAGQVYQGYKIEILDLDSVEKINSAVAASLSKRTSLLRSVNNFSEEVSSLEDVLRSVTKNHIYQPDKLLSELLVAVKHMNVVINTSFMPIFTAHLSTLHGTENWIKQSKPYYK